MLVMMRAHRHQVAAAAGSRTDLGSGAVGLGTRAHAVVVAAAPAPPPPKWTERAVLPVEIWFHVLGMLRVWELGSRYDRSSFKQRGERGGGGGS
jgi:hypothetical protein